jgi:integrase
MPRPASGTIDKRETSLGTSYRAKVRYQGVRYTVTLGGSWDGWTEERAADELDYIKRQIARGEWIPPEREAPEPAKTRQRYRFRDVAALLLTKQEAKTGGKSSKTYRDLEWRLAVSCDHIGYKYVDRLDESAIDDMVVALLKESERIRQAAAKGKPLTERVRNPRTGLLYDRKLRPLSNGSINKVLSGVDRVMREARRRKLIDRLPDVRDARVKAATPARPYLQIEQSVQLVAAARELEERHRGLTRTDVKAIRASAAANTRLAKDYGVSDVLIGRIKRGEVLQPPKRRNDVPRVAIIKTLLLAGPRIEHLCALNREHLDLANRRLNLPDHKTGGSARSVPLVPALHDALMNHFLDTEGEPGDPLFPTRDGTRQRPDNVRARIVQPAGGLIGVHVTPHMLRRTFASILAEIGVPPRRAMYLLGHKDASLTMNVYQHVLDVSARIDTSLEALLGCSSTDAVQLLSGRHAVDESAAAPGRIHSAETQRN